MPVGKIRPMTSMRLSADVWSLLGQRFRSLRSCPTEPRGNHKSFTRRTDGTVSTMLSTGVDTFSTTTTKVLRSLCNWLHRS